MVTVSIFRACFGVSYKIAQADNYCSALTKSVSQRNIIVSPELSVPLSDGEIRT